MARLTRAPYTVRRYCDADQPAVEALWRAAFPDDPPWNTPKQVIQTKRTVQSEMFYVALADAAVIGTVLAGFDGVRGWIHKLAVAPDHRGQGVAQLLMTTAEQALARRGCPKVTLQVRSGNHGALKFYQSAGYAVEERVSLGKQLPSPTPGPLRPQYHFRQTDHGLSAWRVQRLVELSQDLPAVWINPLDVNELHTNHWYFHDGAIPSPASMIEHMRLIDACDVKYPIILDAQGRVMDGMHRVCKAVLHQIERIPAVQFETDPEPDYEQCDPAMLPYD